jgi:hypothetical protein
MSATRSARDSFTLMRVVSRFNGRVARSSRKAELGLARQE